MFKNTVFMLKEGQLVKRNVQAKPHNKLIKQIEKLIKKIKLRIFIKLYGNKFTHLFVYYTKVNIIVM